MSKLAVVFPGIGYTVDKPLLHYSRRLAADAGYEIKLLPYAGFPKKVKGDKGRMADIYRVSFRSRGVRTSAYRIIPRSVKWTPSTKGSPSVPVIPSAGR